MSERNAQPMTPEQAIASGRLPDERRTAGEAMLPPLVVALDTSPPEQP
ncbi:hypothetical protein [Azonexus sp.]|jgi:hypothetical protein|nr:hypothetical protein [Azonexus sp.]MDR1995112.1 hypothetical protein [Azonexus sp.]